jgi:hypothetical protein
MKVFAYDGTSFPLTSEHSRYLFLHNRRNTKKNKKRVEPRKTESSKHAYHELQMSDMKFEAHSAFIAPTHRKYLRVVHMRICTVITPERKEAKEGRGTAFKDISNPTQQAEWRLI